MGGGLDNAPYDYRQEDSMHDLVDSPPWLDCNYDPETFAPSPLRDRLIQATDGKLQKLAGSAEGSPLWTVQT